MNESGPGRFRLGASSALFRAFCATQLCTEQKGDKMSAPEMCTGNRRTLGIIRNIITFQGKLESRVEKSENDSRSRGSGEKGKRENHTVPASYRGRAAIEVRICVKRACSLRISISTHGPPREACGMGRCRGRRDARTSQMAKIAAGRRIPDDNQAKRMPAPHLQPLCFGLSACLEEAQEVHVDRKPTERCHQRHFGGHTRSSVFTIHLAWCLYTSRRRASLLEAGRMQRVPRGGAHLKAAASGNTGRRRKRARFGGGLRVYAVVGVQSQRGRKRHVHCVYQQDDETRQGKGQEETTVICSLVSFELEVKTRIHSGTHEILKRCS
ncbi:hypothetical protein K438DRAFT_1752782 [Mycena galopus ATCC 62051]|nr:hypothetical protein K438DRAFT_1752782 [Mycena galopus ATCC 62051]